MSATEPTIMQEPVVSDDNVIISWTGGVPPFQLQKKDSIVSAYQNIGRPTIARSKTLPRSGAEGYFRVNEQIPMLDADLSDPNVTKLVWDVPDME